MLKNLYDDQNSDEALDSLRVGNKRFVPGMGPTNPAIMLVGSLPGRLEDARGLPMLGRLGSLLVNFLTQNDIDPYTTFMTNVFKYWPEDPNNKGRMRPPTPEELKVNAEYVKEEIRIVNPKIVGLLGQIPLNAIYPDKKNLHSVHGMLLDNQYVPLYQPSVVINNPDKTDIVNMGFRLLRSYS